MRMLCETEAYASSLPAVSAFLGPLQLMGAPGNAESAAHAYLDAHHLTDETLKNSTHICWATGGALVPEDVWEEYFQKAKAFC